MKRILIAGASTFGVKNLGDDAMFCNLVVGLRREFPGCELTFLARHPDEQFDRTFGVHSIKNFEHENKAQSLGRWFWGFNPGDPTDHVAAIRKAIEECDVVVIGGNSFMEISESQFLRGVPSYAALLATWAKLFEKPYVLYGVACPTLRNEYTKQVARFLCENAALVTVREDFSVQQLRDAGVDVSNVQVLADPAFGVDPVWDKDAGLQVLNEEGITLGSKPLIGICFRHQYWSWSDGEFEAYARTTARFCDWLVHEFKVELLFIPNCTYAVDTENEDDRIVLASIREKMNECDQAHLIKGDYDLHKILSLFQFLDMMISSRRHSCAFAAIHHVPFLAAAMGYSYHFQPFLESLSLDDAFVDLTEESLEEFREKVRQAWDRKANTARIIQRMLPELRRKAHRHVELIANMLHSQQTTCSETILEYC